MIQIGHPLPAGVPGCGNSTHRAQLIECRGAPRGHRIGSPCPPYWHVECFQCGVATMPATDQAVALLRWQANPTVFRVPLAHLPAVREHIAAQQPHMASAA